MLLIFALVGQSVSYAVVMDKSTCTMMEGMQSGSMPMADNASMNQAHSIMSQLSMDDECCVKGCTCPVSGCGAAGIFVTQDPSNHSYRAFEVELSKISVEPHRYPNSLYRPPIVS